MKPEAQRIAIARVVGWTIRDAVCLTGATMWVHEKHPYGWRESKDLPDYLTDLNACHEMEKVLTLRHCLEYTHHLGRMEQQDISSPQMAPRFSWHATAAQRAEAFLRCLSLWNDNA